MRKKEERKYMLDIIIFVQSSFDCRLLLNDFMGEKHMRIIF